MNAHCGSISSPRQAERLSESKAAFDAYRHHTFTYHTDDDGTLVFEGRLPADQGALLQRALERATDWIIRDQAQGIEETPQTVRRADALAILAERFLSEPPEAEEGLNTADRFQITVHASAEALLEHGVVDVDDPPQIEDGAVLATETLRRLACDSAIVRILETGDGEPLDIGRKTRVIPPSMHRALKRRDRGVDRAREESVGHRASADNLECLHRADHHLIVGPRSTVEEIAPSGALLWLRFRPHWQSRETGLKTLVIGGTGPTGHFIVNGLLQRGHAVAILHTGRHEVAEIPAHVEHIHTDPFDAEALAASLEGRTFDLTIATYGRLRSTCEVMQGKTERFISVGGVPAYRGYSNPAALTPAGLTVPVAEDSPKSTDRSEDEKGFRVFRSERVVFDHHPTATHFRYPLVYGPYQLVPREWCIVRRIRDRRAFIVLPDGGLTLHHCGYAENIAHALLLAVDRPDVAAGQVYNCADADALTLRQVVDVVADALGHRWDVVSMPYELAACARPLVAQPSNSHRVFDLTKLKTELGYADVVAAPDAFARTAHWLLEHPPRQGGPEERNLHDPFDYAAEDRLVAAWRQMIAALPHVSYTTEPGYTSAYSGPGAPTRKGSW